MNNSFIHSSVSWVLLCVRPVSALGSPDKLILRAPVLLELSVGRGVKGQRGLRE